MVPRETILSHFKEATQYLAQAQGQAQPPPPTTAAKAAVHQRRGAFQQQRLSGGGGYQVDSEGRLVLPRLRDQVRFASATAAVKSALEHHQQLLRGLQQYTKKSANSNNSKKKGKKGSKKTDDGGVRSFVGLVVKDAAKAGGYRLCMHYFRSHMPQVVPWVIDALMRGETLSGGLSEVLQIGVPSRLSD